MDPSTEIRSRLRGINPLILAIVLAILVGTIVLVIGMIEEPYHIDELRQVRAYPRPVEKVVSLSFGQEQPPLDSLIGKVVYEIVGQGHIRQRLHPTILAVLSLGLFAWLLWRSGLRWAVPVAVLTYAIVPLVVGLMAYARQYSLPVFLWLLFLVAATEWMRRRSWFGLLVLVGAAVLLPVSRSVDPMLFLGGVVGTLLVWHLRGAGTESRGSPWPVLGTAAGSVVVIGIPVMLRIRSEASEFLAPAAGLGDRVGRFFTDLPDALAETSEAWPIALAVVILAVASPRVRSFVAREWWFWPLVVVPIGFAGAFFLLANSGQPFYVRYTYSWYMPLAIVAGVVVEEAVDGLHERDGTARAWIGIGAVVAFGLVMTFALVDDLSSDDWVDYEPLGEMVRNELDADVVVFFDNLRPFGLYRAGYAGWGRYARNHFPSAANVLNDPSTVDPEDRFVVGINGPELSVSGWTAIEASDFMYLYLPEELPSGYLAGGDSLIAFGRATDPDTGAMLRLAGATLLVRADQPEAACLEVEVLLSEIPSLQDDIIDAIEGRPLGDAWAACTGG